MKIEQRGRATIDTLKTVAAALPDPEMEGRPRIRNALRERGRVLSSFRNNIGQQMNVLAKQRGRLRVAEAEVAALTAVVADLKEAWAAAKFKVDDPATPSVDRRLLEDKCAALVLGMKETRNGFEMITALGAVSSTVVSDVYAQHNMVPGQGRNLKGAEEWRDTCLTMVKTTLATLEGEITSARACAKLPVPGEKETAAA